MASLKTLNLAALFLLMALILVENQQVITGAQYDFVVQEKSISVVSPLSLSGSKHDGAMGQFGVQERDGFIEGSVFYPTEGSLGCKPFENNELFKNSIALLDRGACYFALKIWNAQQAGAEAVLVADNIGGPLMNSGYGVDENYVADLKKISIPTALIKKSFGDTLKNALKSHKNVVVKLEWKGSLSNASSQETSR